MQAHQILDEDSAHLGALEVLSKSLWRTGQFEQLLAVLDKMSALNPYEPGYASLKGSALQCLGRYGEATRAFQRGMSIPGSKEALTEIQAWQQELVGDLVKTDAVFKTHFARNPKEACASRGFYFASEPYSGAKWWPAAQERGWMYTRPS